MGFVDMEFVVRLGPDADDREVAEGAGQLRRELLTHDVEDVRFAEVRGESREGAKSGAVAGVGTLIVTLGPQAISAVLAALQTWADRDAARSVEIHFDGDSFVGSGLTRKQQDALVAGFLERTAQAQAAEPTDGEA
jgi:hypothetical protein